MEKAPHFVEYVRRYVEEKYGKDAFTRMAFRSILPSIFISREVAQEAVESGLKEIEKRQKYSIC